MMAVRSAEQLSGLSPLLNRYNLTRLTLGFYLSYFLFFMVLDSLEVTMPLLFESRNMSIAYLGFMLTASKIARALLVIPVSRVPRSRKLKVLAVVLLVNSAALSLALATGSSPGIVVACFLLITTTSIFNVIMNPLLAACTDQSRLGITFGVRDVFLYLGGFLGVMATGQLLRVTGDDFGGVFVAYVAVLLLLAGVLRWCLPGVNALAATAAMPDPVVPGPRCIRSLDQRFIYYLLVSGLITLGSMSLVYAPLFGRQLGMDSAWIYTVFSSHILVAALLSLFGGMIIDRCDKKRVYMFTAGLYVLGFGLLSLGGPLPFVLGLLVLGGQAALANIDSAYLFSIFGGQDTDRYWGVVSLVSLVAGSLGVVGFGYLWEAGWPIFHVSLAVMALAGLLSLRLPRQAV